MSKNALGQETSPYLLQHADNPVDWYPWSEGALQKARQENKPILLSIGYSACHWCHVMAHESFEDEATAQLMNEHFINIKVDREERPDIDRIYQTAQHLLTRRSGGWPLTMFLTPDDQVPFFGGTYFPRESQYKLPGFRDLLLHISKTYRENEQAIRDQNVSMLEALDKLEPAGDSDSVILHPGPLQTAITQYRNAFNQRSGGFGGAPKFPQPTNLEFLLQYSANRLEVLGARDEARGMALFTLEKMCHGGIYDHLGGGFARYSVDDDWMIPHFEKMLYDNGPLLGLCSSAWQITGDELYRRRAMHTAEWVMREMQSPNGGYYSSLDADSEGEEGKFYVWDREELQQHLDQDEYELFAHHYGVDQGPNFEGRWHLYARHSAEETAKANDLTVEACLQRLKSAAGKLLAARKTRIAPGRDDKVLTSWNALMIRGMADAGRVFDAPELIDSAVRALDDILQRLWVDGRLLATARDDRAHLNAYLDDHALLIEACIALLQARWNNRYLQFATQLADVLLEHFADSENQGFFFTSHDHERLTQRNKPYMDETLPAGNGAAARALILIGHLLAESRYLEAAHTTIRSGWASLERVSYAHGSLLCALLDHLAPPELVILRGPEATIGDWQREIIRVGFQPNRLVFAIPETESGLPGILSAPVAAGRTSAVICVGDRCLAPVNELETLLGCLKTGKTG
ncbi:MAG: thioredoxin domain-containing protein [Thiotrichales bacterium]|nr:thioredoxin domain-containing protein [Thiotrichales bacterium]